MTLPPVAHAGSPMRDGHSNRRCASAVIAEKAGGGGNVTVAEPAFRSPAILATLCLGEGIP